MSALTGKRVNNNKKSAVKDHCFLSGRMCSFDDFTVVSYESHKFKRLIKEILLVIKEKLLNKQAKSLKLKLPIKLFYYTLYDYHTLDDYFVTP